MARPRRIDSKLVTKARAVAGATLEQTAALLGVGRATVPRLQARLRERAAGVAPVARGWGGRRRALLTRAQETAFLTPWLEQARHGSLVVGAPLRAALATRLGHPVGASVIYRMLARHGWRKVAPDTRHPKSDPAAQARWKKNSPRCWHPC